MPASPALDQMRTTLTALAIGLAGFGIATLLRTPAPVLIGPAVLVSLAAVAGIRVDIAPVLRNACFVILGIGIGAGFDSDASAAIRRWPLAFAALAGALFVSLLLSRIVLERAFGLDRRSASLAAAPGHLSFVMSLAADTRADIASIAVVQSVRLLALTLFVPYAALAMGYPPISVSGMGGAPMPLFVLAALTAVGIALGFVATRLRLPAALVVGGMLASGIGHVTGITSGGVPPAVLTPAFLVLGTLIGTRFSGTSPSRLRASLGAGIAAMLIAAVVAVLASLPVAALLDLPLVHVLVAFSPGGIETMIAMGAAMGVNPGFVAACHIMRLLILTALVPIFVGRAETVEEGAR